MKHLLHSLRRHAISGVDLLITLCLFALAWAAFGPASAIVVMFALGALLTRTDRQTCMVATLVVARILQRVIDAYKTRLPMLKYFALDVSEEQVKFEQEIIAHMPIVPTATSHTPGDSLETGAQSVTDLMGDVPLKIDQAAKVVLKIPTLDAVKLELDVTFNRAIENAGYALAEYVVMAAINRAANEANFSHEIVEAVADFDRDTLSKARIQLNAQKAPAPRFGLTSLTAMGNLTADPRIASKDYHAKLIPGNPYVTLEGLEGFEAISEFSGFPTDQAIGTFTVNASTDVVTLAGHGLSEGTRIRVASGTTLPAGLSAATDYFVRDVTPNTFKLSATAGGSAVDITNTGTGTHTASRYEKLNAFFFAANAILIAVRQLSDNIDNARKLGIPVPIMVEKRTDPDTGLTFTAYGWIDKATHDVYLAVVVAFGTRGGKQGTGNAADTLVDRSGLRVVESGT